VYKSSYRYQRYRDIKRKKKGKERERGREREKERKEERKRRKEEKIEMIYTQRQAFWRGETMAASE
jgi:hypothetical protein